LGQLCRLKHTTGEQSEPSHRRQTKLTAFRFRLRRKLHIRSFRFPLKIKADALISEGRRRERSALFVTLDENGAMRASSDASASNSIENSVFNRIKKKTPIRAQKPR